MRIVYMGTPDFAVPCLEAIIKQNHQVVGVVTQPDRPKGRGKKMQPPPVKVTAEAHGIPVYQPEKIRTPEFLAVLRELNPELIVVVAYGKILPTDVLNLPPLGCVNVHASILPKYRGSAPIHWAIINGEQKTGVTTMYMNEGMDTGDMILTAITDITATDTVGGLHDRLAIMGSELLAETLALIAEGRAPRTPQNDAEATYAPMLKKEHELVHWQQSALAIRNHIHGLNPWPGSYTIMDGKVLKLWQAELVTGNTKEQPGKVVDTEDNNLVVQTGDGLLAITELQLQGGKRLSTRDFLCGKKVSPGMKLGD
jgi:methionyl-tRNA formyltransferase